MGIGSRLILIDSDTRRRAATCHLMAAAGVYVEPYENVGEPIGRWPGSGVMLVEDRGDAIAAIMHHMIESGDWLPVIGFAEAPRTDRVVKAVRSGAVDYLHWPCDAEAIEDAVGAAQTDAALVRSQKLREARARGRIQRLTQREREVLAAVAGGLSSRKIAERLAISPRTVEIHRANMLNKMGASHTSEAIRIAIEASLLA